jgi:hypothetical protein
VESKWRDLMESVRKVGRMNSARQEGKEAKGKRQVNGERVDGIPS